MVLEICPILLRIAKSINNARGDNGVLNGLVCLAFDVPREECIRLDDR